MQILGFLTEALLALVSRPPQRNRACTGAHDGTARSVPTRIPARCPFVRTTEALRRRASGAVLLAGVFS